MHTVPANAILWQSLKTDKTWVSRFASMLEEFVWEEHIQTTT